MIYLTTNWTYISDTSTGSSYAWTYVSPYTYEKTWQDYFEAISERKYIAFGSIIIEVGYTDIIFYFKTTNQKFAKVSLLFDLVDISTRCYPEEFLTCGKYD